MRTLQRKAAVRILLVAGIGAVLWAVATARVTTRQGADQRVMVRAVPLYAKAVAFVHRHVEYRLLAREITAGLRSDPERVRAVFEWTRRNIRKTPDGWPVIDDHVLHIIIRGYGVADQMADVFTTLATYAGMPAFWRGGAVVLSFVRVDGRWAVFDVANGLVFTDSSGTFIDADELIRQPALVQAVAASLTPRGKPYSWYLERLAPFTVPAALRPELQMPLPRFLFEIQRLLPRLLPKETP